MEKKVEIITIPRIAKEDGQDVPVLFFPEIRVNRGCICGYAHIGQHAEWDLGYYSQTTRKPTEANKAEVEQLIREYENHILEEGETLVFRQRINYDVLRESWK